MSQQNEHEKRDLIEDIKDGCVNIVENALPKSVGKVVSSVNMFKSYDELINEGNDPITTSIAVGAEIIASEAQFTAGLAVAVVGVEILNPALIETGIAVTATSHITGQIAKNAVLKSKQMLVELADFLFSKFDDIPIVNISETSHITLTTPEFSIEFNNKETRFIADLVRSKFYGEQMIKEFNKQLKDISKTHNLLLDDIERTNQLSYKYDETKQTFIIDFESVKDEFKQIVSKYDNNYFDTEYKKHHTILEKPPEINMEPTSNVKWFEGEASGGYYGRGHWEITVPIITYQTDYRRGNGGGGIMCTIL